MSILDTIKGYTAFRLANIADVACPDSDDSAGASFLRSVRDALIEAVEYVDADSLADAVDASRRRDVTHEVADGSPSVYTGERWAEFVDLAAWNEDTYELTGDREDMTTLAGIALYMIAERLCGALLDEIESEADED